MRRLVGNQLFTAASVMAHNLDRELQVVAARRTRPDTIKTGCSLDLPEAQHDPPAVAVEVAAAGEHRCAPSAHAHRYATSGLACDQPRFLGQEDHLSDQKWAWCASTTKYVREVSLRLTKQTLEEALREITSYKRLDGLAEASAKMST